MNKYLEAEKRLAELLGWDGLVIGVPGFACDPAICVYIPGTFRLVEADIPHWCRDDAAAFRLMVEHDIDFVFYQRSVAARHDPTGNRRDEGSEEAFADHPDKATAVRFAIVQAVIAKLEQKREDQNIRLDWPRT